MNSPGLDIPYWSQDTAAVSAALGSGPGGLLSERAAAQLRLVGPNSVEDASHLSALRLFLRQFESPLVLILIFAAVISLVLQQWMDSGIILAIVLASTLLGFFQEYQASAAVEELKRRLALTCRVMRDGIERTVPVSTIVPGDLILLSAGNLIPADGLVIEAEDFLVSEASMTGESFPVEKRRGTVKPDAALSARTNAVFLGASVQSGTAKILAVETGRRTAFGAIAARLRTRQPETDFARGVRQFGYLLIRVMIVIVLFVLTANLLLGRPVIDSLLFAVALAVGLSPELLPAIISVNKIMKKTMLLASAAMIGVSFLAAHANAQGVPQTVEIAKVDVQKVAAGYRASKVIGSSVLNDANETIGKIDDLLVTRDGKEPYAVLSIGGFLGMGTHMVVVRYDSLKFADNKIVLPGGTKDGLKMLPAFEYSKE